jgi:Domain of unknown function (DUF4417)
MAGRAVTAPVLPDRQLGATRSSHRWAEMPGNWDRLNTRALFASTNPWGIPDLPAATVEPARLVAYSARRDIDRASPTDAVHFFLDDYRFETVWSKPERALTRLARVGTALSPDFSLWRDMPWVMQLWQVYRSRWCAAWMLHHGLRVIPTLSWSTPDTFGFAFTGIPAGSVVAVSTVGVHRDPQARDLFRAGYQQMLTQLTPTVVLVYGPPLPDITSVMAFAPDQPSPRVRCYPSHWQHRGPVA